MYVSNLDPHREIENAGRSKTKLCDKGDGFIFPLAIFSLISSYISASPAYGVYISQYIHYSRVCVQYSIFLDRAQLLTQKLLIKATFLLL